MNKSALIIVDVQNDFVEGGSLGVTGGNEVAAQVAKYIALNGHQHDMILTTQDWHIRPGNHFETWPVHCSAGSKGANLHADVTDAINAAPNVNYVRILKGLWDDGYSGFSGEDMTTHKTITETLRDAGITDVFVVGIATDFCVRATALDALKNGFTTTIFVDMIAGVDKDSSHNALIEVSRAGGSLATGLE